MCIFQVQNRFFSVSALKQAACNLQNFPAANFTMHRKLPLLWVCMQRRCLAEMGCKAAGFCFLGLGRPPVRPALMTQAQSDSTCLHK